MDRLFLDANVLFSASYSPNAHYRKLWESTGVELVTTAYAIAETQRNLSDPLMLSRLSELLKRVKSIPAGEVHPLSIDLPDKDRPILLAAIGGKCTHLLTQDLRHFGKHFGSTVDGVLILRPDAYLRARKSKPAE